MLSRFFAAAIAGLSCAKGVERGICQDLQAEHMNMRVID
jgi:hypothetical protein